VTGFAQLPQPLTHAAAAPLDGVLLVFGGRGAEEGSQTAGVLAIAPNGSVSQAGSLPQPLSDLAAAPFGDHVLLAGGRDSGGRTQDAILTVTRRH